MKTLVEFILNTHYVSDGLLIQYLVPWISYVRILIRNLLGSPTFISRHFSDFSQFRRSDVQSSVFNRLILSFYFVCSSSASVTAANLVPSNS
jgi:hypothetical protein